MRHLWVERGAPAHHEAQASAEPLVQFAEDDAADVDPRPLLCRLDDAQTALELFEPPLRFDAVDKVAVHHLEQRGDAEEKRRLHFGHAVADAAQVILERNLATNVRRDDDRDGEGECMMQWQHHHQAVALIERNRPAYLLEIRHEVAMRQHHALGPSGSSRREDDRCDVIGRDLDGGDTRACLRGRVRKKVAVPHDAPRACVR